IGDNGSWWVIVGSDGREQSCFTRYGAGFSSGSGRDPSYRGSHRWATHWAAIFANRRMCCTVTELATDRWEVRSGHGRVPGSQLGLFATANHGQPNSGGRRVFFGTEAWARSWAAYQNSYDGTDG